MKVNNLLQTMKKAIKPPIYYKNEDDKNEIKILTEEEMDKMKDYIRNKITKEQDSLQTNITNYVNVVNNTFKNNNFQREENKAKVKKDFNRFVESLNFGKNIQLINYKKSKPQPIKDRETANLIRIKKLLYPTNLKKKGLKEENKKKGFGYTIRRNASMNNIYSMRNYGEFGKTTEMNNADKLKNIDVSGQDTMQVLTKLAEQKDYLTERMEQKLKRVNSLIEIKLPFLSNYENILNYINRKNKSSIQNKYLSEIDNNEKMVFSPQSQLRNNQSELKPFMRRKILALKNDIQIIDYKNELFNKKFFEDKRMTIYNKLRGTLEKINMKIYRRKERESIINTDKKGDNVFITAKKVSIQK
jgi:hypothetical protein